MRLAVSVLIVAFECGVVTAQTPPAPRSGEYVEVSIVNLDVRVSNPSGTPIRRLSSADFEVFENGVPQTITNFSEFSVVPVVDRQIAEPSPAAVPPEARTIVLFVEHLTMPPARKTALFVALQQMLRKTVRPGDRIAVVDWRGRMSERQPFTSDRNEVARVLDRIAGEILAVAPDPAWELMLTRQRVRRWTDEMTALPHADGRPAVGGWGGSLLLSGESEAQEALRDMEQKTLALKALITRMAAAPGKKVLILLSHRFSEIAGGEFLFNPGSLGVAIAPELRERYGTDRLVDPVIAHANASGVTVYAIHPEGIGTTTMMNAETGPMSFARLTTVPVGNNYDFFVYQNEKPQLHRIADDTGGLAAWGTGNGIDLLHRVPDDLDAYYSMAYRITKHDEDRVRWLSVRVKGHPEYVVRFRRTFVDKSMATVMKDEVLANLFRPAGESSIDLRAQLGTPKKQKRGRYLVPLTVRVPLGSLAALPSDDGQTLSFSIFVTWSSDTHQAGEVTHQAKTMNIAAADVARARSSYYTFEFGVLVDGATDRLSIGVLDDISRERGFAEIKLPPMSPGH
ncbi:MAG: VWA domain-containing protein [Thermoanaerobaculia bacterium]